MKGIIIGALLLGVFCAFVLYCCIRVGAEEDRRLEKLAKERFDIGD